MPATIFEVSPDGKGVFIEQLAPDAGVVKHNVLDEEGQYRTAVIFCEEDDTKTSFLYIASIALTSVNFSKIEPEIEEVVDEVFHRGETRRPFIDTEKGLLDLLVMHRHLICGN